MKNLIFFCAVLCAALSFSCADDDVHIRIENATSEEFNNTFVDTSIGGSHNYGTIAAGDQSDYHAFTSAYRYALMTLDIGGEEYRFQPIDFVGETPLSPGKYTYKVEILDPAFKSLNIDLVTP